jgi:hypothetical protein
MSDIFLPVPKQPSKPRPPQIQSRNSRSHGERRVWRWRLGGGHAGEFLLYLRENGGLAQANHGRHGRPDA